MKTGLLIFVVVAGILNTAQSGSNATLHKSLGRDFFPVVVVFVAGLSVALLAWFFSGERLPSAGAMRQTPWWAWAGGSLGALYILSMILAADKLGAALFMGLTVTLAVITSLVMDHFGLLGFEVHRAGLARMVGGALMISGLALIAKF